MPAAGGLAWNGVAVARDPDAHRRRLRYVGHADAVKPALTAIENLRTWARLWGAGDAAGTSLAALEALGIARLAPVPARFLSAGQRRRLALARLLLVPAPLWLLDEPRSGLDADAADRLDAALAAHRQQGGLVVLALHGDRRPDGAAVLDLDSLRGAALALDDEGDGTGPGSGPEC